MAPTTITHWPRLFAAIETAVIVVLAWLIHFAGEKYIRARTHDHRERYRRRKFLGTVLSVVVAAMIGFIWAHLIWHPSTFLGLIGAGLAVALRDPLMSIAARLAIFAGHIYSVGDRVEVNQMKGDVIDIGFFYTRLMEIGNWIGGDQYTGRVVQFSNSILFGAPVFNYTQHFEYIWDEVMLPVTYRSNIKAASDILMDAGSKYTQKFLERAEKQLEGMQRYFLVPRFELEPNVYIKVTSNWIELTMRYVVDPKQRRTASTFIYEDIFAQVKDRKDIIIASETTDVTVHTSGADMVKFETDGEPARKSEKPRAA